MRERRWSASQAGASSAKRSVSRHSSVVNTGFGTAPAGHAGDGAGTDADADAGAGDRTGATASAGRTL
ncbi:hypothetical protein GCM10009654_51650 [Streptomyces hebeiensis]|uniref:Uncharacterized protein n=1 Tax=Streptomyces hebeiensis TaxID=229486 RepID=A0ABN1V155_9ACTN